MRRDEMAIRNMMQMKQAGFEATMRDDTSAGIHFDYKEAPPAPERCECCGKIPKIDSKTGKTQSLRLDHDHSTEKFRGWICDRCNSGIGKLGDNVDGIVKALNYLIERR